MSGETDLQRHRAETVLLHDVGILRAPHGEHHAAAHDDADDAQT